MRKNTHEEFLSSELREIFNADLRHYRRVDIKAKYRQVVPRIIQQTAQPLLDAYQNSPDTQMFLVNLISALIYQSHPTYGKDKVAVPREWILENCQTAKIKDLLSKGIIKRDYYDKDKSRCYHYWINSTVLAQVLKCEHELKETAELVVVAKRVSTKPKKPESGLALPQTALTASKGLTEGLANYLQVCEVINSLKFRENITSNHPLAGHLAFVTGLISGLKESGDYNETTGIIRYDQSFLSVQLGCRLNPSVNDAGLMSIFKACWFDLPDMHNYDRTYARTR
jgi:hypothetical protein